MGIEYQKRCIVGLVKEVEGTAKLAISLKNQACCTLEPKSPKSDFAITLLPAMKAQRVEKPRDEGANVPLERTLVQIKAFWAETPGQFSDVRRTGGRAPSHQEERSSALLEGEQHQLLSNRHGGISSDQGSTTGPTAGRR